MSAPPYKRAEIVYEYLGEIPEDADDDLVTELDNCPAEECWLELGHLVEEASFRRLTAEELERYRAVTTVLWARLFTFGELFFPVVCEALEEASPDLWNTARAMWHSRSPREREAFQELVAIEQRPIALERVAPTSLSAAAAHHAHGRTIPATKPAAPRRRSRGAK